jgi:hypothetical protein
LSELECELEFEIIATIVDSGTSYDSDTQTVIVNVRDCEYATVDTTIDPSSYDYYLLNETRIDIPWTVSPSYCGSHSSYDLVFSNGSSVPSDLATIDTGVSPA